MSISNWSKSYKFSHDCLLVCFPSPLVSPSAAGSWLRNSLNQKSEENLVHSMRWLWAHSYMININEILNRTFPQQICCGQRIHLRYVIKSVITKIYNNTNNWLEYIWLLTDEPSCLQNPHKYASSVFSYLSFSLFAKLIAKKEHWRS